MDTASSTVSCVRAKPMKAIFSREGVCVCVVGGKSVFWDKESLGFLQTHYLIFTVCCLTSFPPFLPHSSLSLQSRERKNYMSEPWFITLRAQDAFVCLQGRKKTWHMTAMCCFVRLKQAANKWFRLVNEVLPAVTEWVILSTAETGNS